MRHGIPECYPCLRSPVTHVSSPYRGQPPLPFFPSGATATSLWYLAFRLSCRETAAVSMIGILDGAFLIKRLTSTCLITMQYYACGFNHRSKHARSSACLTGLLRNPSMPAASLAARASGRALAVSAMMGNGRPASR